MDGHYSSDEESTIAFLDGLVREFYSPESSNSRKKEIEAMLNAFSSRDDSYVYCLKMLSCHSENMSSSSAGRKTSASGPAPASLMFCLSVLERTVSRVGTSESNNNKASSLRLEILVSVWKFLTNGFKSVPVYVRNKTGKVIADIGLQEWPSPSLPSFLNDILSLVHSKETAVIGLFLLESTIEEWTAILSRPDQEILSGARRETLIKLFSSQVPMILTLLVNMMESLVDQVCQGIALSETTATATPPPSPTSSLQGIPVTSSSANSSSSSIHASTSATISSSLPSSSSSGSGLLPFFVNNPHLSKSSQSLVFGNEVSSALNSHTSSSLTMRALKHHPPTISYSGADMDPDSLRVCYSSLSCVGHLISWMPLQSFLSCFHSSSSLESLMSSLFFFAGFGCLSLDSSLSSSRTMPVSTSIDSTIEGKQVGLLALNCFNEISAKNCITPDNLQFMSELFQTAFQLVQEFLKRDDSDPGLLLNLDDEYLAKCTEFLRLFVSAHLPRLESIPFFPLEECLSLMFKYTFKLSADRLASCLDIWNLFVDYVLSQFEQSKKALMITSTSGETASQTSCSRFHPSLVMLAKEITCKMQYELNLEQIESFDEEVIASIDPGNTGNQKDNNNSMLEEEGPQSPSTEWVFTTHCIEILAKIAEVVPLDVFYLLSEILVSNLNVYTELQHLIGKGLMSGNKSSNEDIDRIHLHLKDLVTSIQLVGRLASNFTHEFFEERYSVSKGLLEMLIKAVKYSSQAEFYHSTEMINPIILSDIALVHSELFASLRSYSYWMMQASQADSNHGHEFAQLLTCIVDEAVSIIVPARCENPPPSQVTHSCLLCLTSIHEVTRSRIFLSLPSIHSLIKTTVTSINCPVAEAVYADNHCRLLKNNMASLTREDELLLFSLISKMLSLPWSRVPDSDQEWSERGSHHDHVIIALVSPLKSLMMNLNSATSNTTTNGVKVAVRSILPVLTFMTRSHLESGTRSKQILFNSLQEVTGICIQLLEPFLPDGDVGQDLLSFFLSLFQVLRSQIKRETIEQVVGIILRIYSNNHSITCGKNRDKILHHVLKLLTFIIQQPIYSYKPMSSSSSSSHISSSSLIPEILSLVLNQISPCVALDDQQQQLQSPPNQTQSDQGLSSEPEVVTALFDFYHEFLSNNFKYFFGNKPSSSSSTVTNSISNIDHESEFVKMMESYGRSFVSARTDIQVYRKNLSSLQSLNEKYQLFHKDYFRGSILKEFLTLFLRTFVSKTHELFQDELTSMIFEMASVDLPSFHSNFVPEFVSTVTRYGNVVVKDTFPLTQDLPSFSLNLHKFSTDLRFSQMSAGHAT